MGREEKFRITIVLSNSELSNVVSVSKLENARVASGIFRENELNLFLGTFLCELLGILMRRKLEYKRTTKRKFLKI